MSIVCKETWSDIVAVYPFAMGGIDYAVPFNVRKRNYTLADLGVSTSLPVHLANRPCLTISPDFDGSDCIELAEGQTTIKSTSKENVAGRFYDILFSLIISEKSEKSVIMADDLSSKAHDFIVLLGDGNYVLLRCDENAYKTSIEETYSLYYELKITANMETYNGVIRITT
jgi:hypothetical protein